MKTIILIKLIEFWRQSSCIVWNSTFKIYWALCDVQTDFSRLVKLIKLKWNPGVNTKRRPCYVIPRHFEILKEPVVKRKTALNAHIRTRMYYATHTISHTCTYTYPHESSHRCGSNPADADMNPDKLFFLAPRFMKKIAFTRKPTCRLILSYS